MRGKCATCTFERQRHESHGRDTVPLVTLPIEKNMKNETMRQLLVESQMLIYHEKGLIYFKKRPSFLMMGLYFRLLKEANKSPTTRPSFWPLLASFRIWL